MPLTEEEKIIKPIQAYYFGNAITKVVGRENLKTYMMRSEEEGGLCKLSVAECCKSFIMTDNPAYGGMVVATKKTRTDSTCNDLPTVCRLSIESWDTEKYGELPPYTGEGTQIKGKMPDMLGFLFSHFIPNVMRKPLREAGDMTV